MSFQSPSPRGKLVSALAISVLLHVLLIWPSVRPLQRGGEPALPLAATLRPMPTAVPPPTRLPAPARKENPPAPLSFGAAAPSYVGPPNTHDSTMESSLRSEPVASAAAKGAAPAAQVPAAAPPAGDGPDADGVRQYRLALAVEARRFKRYPPLAMEANLGGTVEIRVEVAPGGHPQGVTLGRSSGYDMLDDAALEMMKKAAPGAVVPESLRRRAFAVSLPVVFDLADN